jgi:hypothetical protein
LFVFRHARSASVNGETRKDGAKLQQIKIYEYDMRQNGAFAAPPGQNGRPGARVQIGALFAFSRRNGSSRW